MEYKSSFINYWVEPDGTTHIGYGVGWHSEFAVKWCKDNLGNEEDVYAFASRHVEYLEHVRRWVRYCGWVNKGVWAVESSTILTKAQKDKMYELTKYK